MRAKPALAFVASLGCRATADDPAPASEAAEQAATAPASNAAAPPTPTPADDTTIPPAPPPTGYTCTTLEPDKSCCAMRLGFDPLAIAEACELGSFLGESDDFGCELHYAGKDSAGKESQPEVVLRLRELRHRDLESAWALHREGFRAPETKGEVSGTIEGIPGSHWSAFEGRTWAFVPGWSHARQIGWHQSDCPIEQLTPILVGALAARQPAPEPAPRWTASGELPTESLASRYGARSTLDAAARSSWILPRNAISLIGALIRAAVHGDRESGRSLLTPNASFGLPDRREYDAWPIAEGDNLERLLANLAAVAARLPADAERTCPPLVYEAEAVLARGEAPMWCFYTDQSSGAFDILTFRLRTIDGVAHVDYVGMGPNTAVLNVPREGEPPPPSMTPATLAARGEGP